MPARNYANAPSTTLVTGVTAVDTSLQVVSVVGFPAAPYTLILDRGSASEEVIQVSAVVGTTLTVLRGQDSTTAWSHNAGAPVQHGVSARDFREANQHINATTGVHGVSGNLVGDTNVQTLTNKTLTSPTINTPTVAGPTITDGLWKGLIAQAKDVSATLIASFKDVGGTVQASIDKLGKLFSTAIDLLPNGLLRIYSTGTGNYIEVYDSGGVLIGYIDSAARARFPNVKGTDTTAVGINTTTEGGLSVGAATGPNLAMDPSHVQARNNGVAAALNLNTLGGAVNIGGPGAVNIGGPGVVTLGDSTQNSVVIPSTTITISSGKKLTISAATASGGADSDVWIKCGFPGAGVYINSGGGTAGWIKV